METPAAFRHHLKAATEKETGTLIMLHGTGGDEFSMLDIASVLDPSAAVLGVKGNSTEEGVNRFFRRLSEGVFDEVDLHKQVKSLAHFLREAKSYYSLPEPLTLVGYSNGANTAAALLLTDPELADAEILFHSVMPFEPTIEPELLSKRVFMWNGASDPMAPLPRSKRLAEALKEWGAIVEHHIVPGGHSLTAQALESAKKWLHPSQV